MPATDNKLGKKFVVPRLVFRILLWWWPLVAIYMAFRPNIVGWYRNWIGALRRPDLYLFLSPGPFSQDELQTLYTPIVSHAAGQLQWLKRPSPGWENQHKLVFEDSCSEHGIPTFPKIPWDEVEPTTEYIAKPENDLGGNGIFAVRGDEVDAKVDKSTHFIQERIRNHKRIHELLGDNTPLSTLRVESTMTGDDDYQIVIAFLRMGFPGSIVDNADKGGMFSIVNLESGQLGPAATYKTEHEGWDKAFQIKVHPGTKIPIEGFEIPFFHEGLALCLEGHRKLVPDIIRVSWDVVMTDEGPRLLELGCAFGGLFLKCQDETADAYLKGLQRHIAQSRAA